MQNKLKLELTKSVIDTIKIKNRDIVVEYKRRVNYAGNRRTASVNS